MEKKIAKKLNEEQIKLNKKKASIHLEFAQKQELTKNEDEKQKLKEEEKGNMEI